MKAENFCYWLQGKLELDGEPTAWTKEQVACVAAHLALVFKHDIDPKAGGAEVQEALNQMHAGSASIAATPNASIGGHAPGRPDVLFRC